MDSDGAEALASGNLLLRNAQTARHLLQGLLPASRALQREREERESSLGLTEHWSCSGETLRGALLLLSLDQNTTERRGASSFKVYLCAKETRREPMPALYC